MIFPFCLCNELKLGVRLICPDTSNSDRSSCIVRSLTPNSRAKTATVNRRPLRLRINRKRFSCRSSFLLIRSHPLNRIRDIQKISPFSDWLFTQYFVLQKSPSINIAKDTKKIVPPTGEDQKSPVTTAIPYRVRYAVLVNFSALSESVCARRLPSRP